ncbi:hypothetical protein UPYG_G00144700 [Umbra pygmaea]|uniref:RNase H type-1 domain-containing protein n=1 Tax=Umbra pygmaea TaxID=75934 RepID=A0ABD0X0K4_UMBPY
MRSVFDYGCIVYGSAATTSLKKLDVIQNQGLRLCCGAIKTIPIATVQVEMGEMPLHLRRDQLALVYWANLRGHGDKYLSQSVLWQCQERENDRIKSFGWTIRQKVIMMGISALDISPSVVGPVVPPWLLLEVPVDLGLLEEKEVHEVDHYRVQGYISKNYKEGIIIYTDASKKTDTKMGIAYVIPQLNIEFAKIMNDDLAVYTAELLAIWMALLWVESNNPKQAVIASDSSSALTSLKLQLASNLIKAGISTPFIWVPAHIGVGGKELADRCAKKAAELPDIEVDIKYSKAEVKSLIKAKTIAKWQLCGIMNSLGDTCIAFKDKWGRTRIHTDVSKKKIWGPK